MPNLKVIERGYNSQVVELLEAILAEAKAGDVVSAVITWETRGEYVTSYSGCDDLCKLLGHLSRQTYLTNCRMDG